MALAQRDHVEGPSPAPGTPLAKVPMPDLTSTLDRSYHYPPDVLELLVDTIPRLIKSKAGLLEFFEETGTEGNSSPSGERSSGGSRERQQVPPRAWTAEGPERPRR